MSETTKIITTTTSMDHSFVRILAGKGGFGAQLRSLAKQKGAKRTVDFSACRDLNGRRLRHVNNELILKNWKEANDRGEKFDVEQQTSTGIDLWFLNVLFFYSIVFTA